MGKPLRIIHTADWHIGQAFYQFDRYTEHADFLSWLEIQIIEQEADVLLVSGDVFDTANPSAGSVKLFYQFLSNIIQKNIDIQIIITAGNHDSAARLEAPAAFLKQFNIHIIGSIPKLENGAIDYESLIIPIKKNEAIVALCLAVPYLRMGDYPTIIETNNAYAEGIIRFYDNLLEQAAQNNEQKLPLISMGHLHTLDAQLGEDDKAERAIMGGIEFVPIEAFENKYAYTALGHIHRAQSIGKTNVIRYCGSPLPMSFSETKYLHQLLLVEIASNHSVDIKSIPVPISIPLMVVPSKHQLLTEVLEQLALLPEGAADNTSPFLEVKVLLTQPEPSLRYQVESALQNKAVRLVKISTAYLTEKQSAPIHSGEIHQQQLEPEELFKQVFEEKYLQPLPEHLLDLFREVNMEITQSVESI